MLRYITVRFMALALAGVLVGAALPAYAQGFTEWSGLGTAADSLGYNTEGETEPAVVAGRIVQYAISLLGVIFLVLIVIGYVKMSTAGGNDEAVAEGKAWVRNGALGMLVVMAAYLIVRLVLYALSGTIFNL